MVNSGKKPAILKVSQLSVRIRDTGASLLKGISFSLPSGSISALIGRSGSGKTLLAKSLLDLLPGSLQTSIRGIQYAGMSTAVSCRRKLCGREILYLPQNASAAFNPSRKLGRQLQENSLENDPRILDSLLISLGFTDCKRIVKSYPFELSEGMNLRCMLALAGLLKPKILILDEPTASLDRCNRLRVIRFLKRMRKTLQTTILIISHDLSLVHGAGEFLLVMDDGVLVDQGWSKDLEKQTSHPFTAACFDARRRQCPDGYSG